MKFYNKSGIKDSQSTDDDKTENVTVDTAYCDNAKSGINDREINNCDIVDNIDIETSKCDFVETSFKADMNSDIPLQTAVELLS